MSAVKQERKVKLKLLLPYQVQFGETVAMVGSSKWLGGWKNPKELQWSEKGWWVAVEADAADEVEFKFLVMRGGEWTWEDGPNRHFQVPRQAGSEYEAEADWGQTTEALKLRLLVEPAPSAGTGSQLQEGEAGAGKSASSDGRAAAGADDPGSEFVKAWQGSGVEFMKSNEHSGQRQGQWNTAGLEGPALHIVDGDKSAGNWRRKLEVVRATLLDHSASATEQHRLASLTYAGVYLQWINTGQLRCVEDGGHHRPNRHAEISREIFCYLEKDGSYSPASPLEVLAKRKIHPKLPAFTAEFTASVPLTRIRDIAHRNDIPHELKQEIKHTIQNKLHRNAGPEDLVATEMLLQRVTRQEGEYSQAFVEQLQIFYLELKDFFNASSLTDKLEGIRSSMDVTSTSLLDAFLTAKKALDEDQGATTSTRNGALGTSGGEESDGVMNKLLAVLHTLTGLRAVLLKGLESGLRNDAPDEAIAMRQKWRLAEIGLEDFSFVILSRFLNKLEESGGAEALAGQLQGGRLGLCGVAMGATVLGLRQMGLSGWQQTECIAIENELLAWQKAGLGSSSSGVVSADDVKLWALRLKATIHRARRLVESYTEALLELYSEPAMVLGAALGVASHAAKTFAEAEARAGVVFQVAKLCSLLLKGARYVAGGGWDVIMPGEAVGTLVQVDRIVPGALPPVDGNVILLLKHADGDEEVKGVAGNVSGVVLLQELPHLSHLGVRARQERVTFVTCEDDDQVEKLRSLLGRRVRLQATGDAVEVAAYEGGGGGRGKSAAMARVLPPAHQEAPLSTHTNGRAIPDTAGTGKVVKMGGGTLLDLPGSAPDCVGAKAAACGKLEAMAASAVSSGAASFQVPAGVAIPFGAMDAALADSGSEGEYQQLLQKLETTTVEGGALESLCQQLQQLIKSLRLSDNVVRTIAARFPPGSRLIVRSSANVEDLAGMSGAGLYESIPNVSVHGGEVDGFVKAVAEVWASLYTRRAVLSRRMAGVKQEDAAMAVLVQELLSPQLSFVLHTRSPVDDDTSAVHAEIALGLGETLAAGTRGSPWRIAAKKQPSAGSNTQLQTFAFANFSKQLVVVTETERERDQEHRVEGRVVDYSRQALSVSKGAREELGRRLADIGSFLEGSLGCAQDVEGCVVGDQIFVVQTRPQP